MGEHHGPVIAIDGPSGSGKSTVARALARRLGLRYLDTGAMYRAVTWAVLHRDVDPHDADRVAAVAADCVVTLGTGPDDRMVRVDGTDVTSAIRGDAVTGAVSAVSAVPAVREAMAWRQREIAAAGRIVVEGRDIGTVVLPDAAAKVFLTAADAERASRRSRETHGVADSDQVARTAADLARRDALDSGRAASPLTKAADAVEIDSSHLSVEQVVERIVALLPVGSGS